MSAHSVPQRDFEVLAAPAGDTPLHLALGHGVLIVGQRPGAAGVAVVVAAERLDAPTFAKFASAIGPSGTPVKLVGPQVCLDLAQTLAAANGWSVAARRATSQVTEVLYWPTRHQLKVATAPAPAVTPLSKATRCRVMIVDDSASIRKLLRRVLERDESIEILGEADRPSAAKALLEANRPDVVTLDIHMPEQDGVSFLRQELVPRGIAAIMITALGQEDGPLVLDALAAGAVDYVQKPSMDDLDDFQAKIAEKVKAAARAKVRTTAPRMKSSTLAAATMGTRIPILFGSSTGGTEAVLEVLRGLPAEIPPILVAQHIPPLFSTAFAERLDELLPFEVKEAADGDEVRPGRVLIAPGGFHMTLEDRRGALEVKISTEPPQQRHHPSVDVLFDSGARCLGKRAIGVLLTGMGVDGAKGLLKMREAGAATVAQDEATSIVYGMPREAARLGAAEAILPLGGIAEHLVRLSGRRALKAS